MCIYLYLSYIVYVIIYEYAWIYTYKTVTFFYSNMLLSEKEINKSIPFKVTSLKLSI